MTVSPATFAIHTFGCKVNQYESQLLREELHQLGLAEREAAAWQIVNGCVVTQTAQTECRRLVQRLRVRYPHSRVLVTGCYGFILGQTSSGTDEHIVVIPQGGKAAIAARIAPGAAPLTAKETAAVAHGYISRSIRGFRGHSRAFVKIQDGCDQWCSYCIVPAIRGRSRSKPRDVILSEVKRLAENRYVEVVLTGIDLGAWGNDLTEKENLAGLARKLLHIKGVSRIRLSSLEMNYMTPQLIALFRDNPRFCPHAHIPLQSGDDEILRRMNRPYRSADFLRKIELLRSAIPRMAVTTDILVGFPGETDTQFQNTLAVCRAAGFSRSHVFPYSCRPGTAAAKFGRPVDPRVIRTRCAAARRVAEETGFKYRRQLLHTTQQVLAEQKQGRTWTGYTDTYVPVTMTGCGASSGRIISVRITAVTERDTKGKIV